jgi:hypothetical protein
MSFSQLTAAMAIIKNEIILLIIGSIIGKGTKSVFKQPLSYALKFTKQQRKKNPCCFVKYDS